MPPRTPSALATAAVRSVAILSLAAAPAAAEPVVGLTTSNALVSFDSSSPLAVSAPVPITGLQAGETLLGIDFRPATGELFGLGSSSRLYSLIAATGVATPIGGAPFAIPLSGTIFGFDFNPTVDRIRITSDAGQNLRANPITGELVDSDPMAPGLQPDGTLAYGAGDPAFGMAPRVVASAYTNNVGGATSTLLYNIDSMTDTLVTQGTAPGVMPAVGPNTGQLFTVGDLLLDAGDITGFDIASGDGAALLTLNVPGFPNSSLYRVDLGTGAVTFLSAIDAELRGFAIAIPAAPTGAIAALSLLAAARRRR